MHSIRDGDDKCGDMLRPDVKALELQQNTCLIATKSIFGKMAKTSSPDWTKVVINPGPFCKDGLT